MAQDRIEVPCRNEVGKLRGLALDQPHPPPDLGGLPGQGRLQIAQQCGRGI